jgi:hypothetical protein
MSCDRFDTTDGDIILRSADQQDFRVHKTILSLASPVFRDMLSLPQPPASESATVPVVDLSENWKVLDVFLRCIYPISKPTVDDLELLGALVDAADKYEAEVVLNMVGSWLAVSRNLKEDPFGVYAITCGSPALRKPARDAVGRITFDSIANADPKSVTRLTGVNHHRLVTYLLRRERGANDIFDKPGSFIIFRGPRCDCRIGAKQDIKNGINEALKNAFKLNPSISVEYAVVLACKQLSKVPACDLKQDCSLVVQGEKYARELMQELIKLSDDLWRCV